MLPDTVRRDIRSVQIELLHLYAHCCKRCSAMRSTEGKHAFSVINRVQAACTMSMLVLFVVVLEDAATALEDAATARAQFVDRVEGYSQGLLEGKLEGISRGNVTRYAREQETALETALGSGASVELSAVLSNTTLEQGMSAKGAEVALQNAFGEEQELVALETALGTAANIELSTALSNSTISPRLHELERLCLREVHKVSGVSGIHLLNMDNAINAVLDNCENVTTACLANLTDSDCVHLAGAVHGHVTVALNVVSKAASAIPPSVVGMAPSVKHTVATLRSSLQSIDDGSLRNVTGCPHLKEQLVGICALPDVRVPEDYDKYVPLVVAVVVFLALVVTCAFSNLGLCWVLGVIHCIRCYADCCWNACCCRCRCFVCCCCSPCRHDREHSAPTATPTREFVQDPSTPPPADSTLGRLSGRFGRDATDRAKRAQHEGLAMH